MPKHAKPNHEWVPALRHYARTGGYLHGKHFRSDWCKRQKAKIEACAPVWATRGTCECGYHHRQSNLPSNNFVTVPPPPPLNPPAVAGLVSARRPVTSFRPIQRDGAGPVAVMPPRRQVINPYLPQKRKAETTASARRPAPPPLPSWATVAANERAPPPPPPPNPPGPKPKRISTGILKVPEPRTRVDDIRDKTIVFHDKGCFPLMPFGPTAGKCPDPKCGGNMDSTGTNRGGVLIRRVKLIYTECIPRFIQGITLRCLECDQPSVQSFNRKYVETLSKSDASRQLTTLRCKLPGRGYLMSSEHRPTVSRGGGRSGTKKQNACTIQSSGVRGATAREVIHSWILPFLW